MLPEFESGKVTAAIFDWVSCYSSTNLDDWKKWDLADSRHVWLPLEFDAQGKPMVPWHDQWSLKEKK